MPGELSLHKHPDSAHSLMALEGKVRAKVADKFYEMSEGDFISIPANEPRKCWNLSDKPSYLQEFD